MELSLQHKTALVCGGSQGIGRAVAEALAAQGAEVLILARGAEALASAAASVCSSSRGISRLKSDSEPIAWLMDNYVFHLVLQANPDGRKKAEADLEAAMLIRGDGTVLASIDQFFSDQNLTLAAGKTWRNVSANIFAVVDGKRILFENDDSLFHGLRQGPAKLELLRERVAAAMTTDEIHDDVHRFFAKLVAMVQDPS